jgi:hypothetical protein
MRFLMITKGAEGQGMPPQEMIDAVENAANALTANGSMVVRGGLYPAASGTRVRMEGGRVTVTDGPFAEAKEVVGGFAILDLKSREEATRIVRDLMELHRKYWPNWVGETEIRRVFDGEPDFEMLQNAGKDASSTR